MGDSTSMKRRGLQPTSWPTGKNRWRSAAYMSLKKQKKRYPAGQCKGAHQWIIQSSTCQSIRVTRFWSGVHCIKVCKAYIYLLTTLVAKVQGHPSSSLQLSYPSFLQFSYPCLGSILLPDEVSQSTSNKPVLLKIFNLFVVLKTPVIICCLKFHNHIFI